MRTYSETESNIPYESFNVNINFDKIGYKNFQALYIEPAKLFLPVNDIFSFLKIPTKTNEDGSLIQGFFNNEKNTFVINYSEHSIIYLGQKTVFPKDEMILDMNQLFVQKDALEKIFDFKINFNFRGLSANFGSTKELPLARLMKLEKARENIRQKTGEEKVDSIYNRHYHWFKFGMMDWSYTSTQSREYTGETRGGVGLGAEALGGETSIWLTYSDLYGFKKEQQRYYWRWVDNQNSIARQVQIGRINTNSVASLLYPLDGFMVTNAPTTIRKALGQYQIANYTQPNWLVEIYINNVLINYTKADASGYYSFNVPIVYGSSNITLKFYGPNGEEKSEQKTFNMPYTMLPRGEFEYKATGGSLLDTTNSRYGRAETNYGLTRWLTVGAGIEYLSSIHTHPEIPFINALLQPIPKLILTGEYDHNVRTKGTLNYSFLNNTVLDLNYIKYKKGQDAIIYNYLEERYGSLSVPFRVSKVSGITKASYRQNVYSSFKYNTAELMLSAYYLNFNANITNYSTWMTAGSSNIYTDFALSTTLGKICTLRPSVQYNYSTQSFISYKANIERKVFDQGYLSLGYERNILGNYKSFNITFRYDFSTVSTYITSYINNKHIQTAESANGSFAFGSGNNYVLASRYNAVSKSGVTIQAYIDTNWNGKRDAGEPLVGKVNVKCNGGQIYESNKDSIIRIAGLEPFVDYIITMDESYFDNVSWKLAQKTIKICTDPNQFKAITVAIHPMGEVSGLLVDKDGLGKGRILINIYNEQGKLVANTQTESDGYFSYIGLPPGNYTAQVDAEQLRLLKMKAEKISFTIHPTINGESVDVGKVTIENLVINNTQKGNFENDKKETYYKSLDTLDTDSQSKSKTHQAEIYYSSSNKYIIINKSTIEDRVALSNAIVKIIKEMPCVQVQISIWNNDSVLYRLVKNRMLRRNMDLSKLTAKSQQTKDSKILFKASSDKCDLQKADDIFQANFKLSNAYYIQLGAYKKKKNARNYLKNLKANYKKTNFFILKEKKLHKIQAKTEHGYNIDLELKSGLNNS